MNKKNLNLIVTLIIVAVLALLITSCSANALAAKYPSGSSDLESSVILQPIDTYTLKGQFSGDDAYDPAVISNPTAPVFIPLTGLTKLNFSGDDLYDPAAKLPAAIVKPASLAPTGISYSGDDAYDPAVISNLTVPVYIPLTGLTKINFSGDDAYDPAARSKLTASEIKQLIGQISISFSGDDAYDPAANGLTK